MMGLWPKARLGNIAAVQAVLRVMERRAKMLGLDDYEARLADVAERQVALEEAQAIVVVGVIQRVLDRLDLSPEQARVAEIAVPAELRAVDAGEPTDVDIT